MAAQLAATTASIAELQELVGKPLGATAAIRINQDRINTFADATGDRQWIHTDPQRASAGPFGGTVAHGFLTLSLLATILEQLIEVPDAEAALNYGLNKVRFPRPVRVDSDVVGSGHIASVEHLPAGCQVVFNIEIAGAGESKPFCVAEYVVRYIGAKQ